jgi:hypothetical protein
MQVVTAAERCRCCSSPLGPLEHRWCSRPRCREAAFEDALRRAKTLSDAKKIEHARNALLAKAQRAKTDPVAFFELVLRDETTNLHVTVPPHQRVLLSFITHPAHDKAIIILPVGTGKTVTCGGLGLFLLMQNPRLRGIFVSAAQEQAKKPLRIARQIIEESAELRLIAPELIPSRRPGEAWSDTRITVERPAGIKDPSFAALGIDSKEIQGWRVDYAIVDDLLNIENTATPEQRESTYNKFFGQVANRMEPRQTSRLCVLNTTWHTEDYVNRLARHWPTLRMSVYGDVFVSNADRDWSPEDLYVVGTRTIQGTLTEHCRLTAHYPDRARAKVLWPERYSTAEIARQKAKYIHAPGLFKKFFESDATDDESALCKQEFIDRCKRRAREEGILALVPTYVGGMPTFTGVDLAWTPDKKGGATSMFTFGIDRAVAAPGVFVCAQCSGVTEALVAHRPEKCQKCGAAPTELTEIMNERYTVLDIESGHWDALTIIGKLFSKIACFRSYAAVENNATQELLIQTARAMGKNLPIRSLTTTQQGKAHPWQGVIGVFFEMATGRWRFPNGMDEVCPEPMQHFIDACQSYSPTTHTADVLMASFVARNLAMELGYMASEPEGPRVPGQMTETQRALRR